MDVGATGHNRGRGGAEEIMRRANDLESLRQQNAVKQRHNRGEDGGRGQQQENSRHVNLPTGHCDQGGTSQQNGQRRLNEFSIRPDQIEEHQRDDDTTNIYRG